jgi:hypothetical protein
VSPDETSNATIKVGGDEESMCPDLDSRWGGDGRAVASDHSGGLSKVCKEIGREVCFVDLVVVPGSWSFSNVRVEMVESVPLEDK